MANNDLLKRALGIALLAWLPAPTAARATDLVGGASFLVGVPQGDFDRAVDTGYGLQAQALLTPSGKPFGLRIEGSFLIYGSEHFIAPFAGTGGRVGLEVTTDNWIGSFGVGPELAVRSGAVRPYVHALVGLSYFATTSDLRNGVEPFPVASSTNFDDTTFRWSAGGGLNIPVSRTIAIEVGAAYVSNDHVSYLTEGDIHDDGHGGAFLTPRHSRANLVQFTIGVTGRW
jgi:opacity protein-like surface antigen